MDATDPEGAYALGYDASRNPRRGPGEPELRVTSRGGHIAIYRAAEPQLDPPLGATPRPFDGMRCRRNSVEYPDFDGPTVTAPDVTEALEPAREIIGLAGRTLE